MNLIPTIISIGLAASVSVFYLQNQSDEPNKINYRAAFSDFEKSALEFAAHTPLQDISVAMPPSHCANLSYDFEGRLPAGSESNIDISGLNCDMATLSITTADEKDFQALLNAAGASGRSYATEANTSATPPTKTLKWTQRLYSRNTSDLGIKAKLKNTYTGNCISCTSSTKAVHGEWSHEPSERWDGCPAPGVLACGETGTRRCNNPPPLNYGMECPRIDGTLTTNSNRTETRDCLGVPKCGQWVKQANCPTNTCVKPDKDPQKESICRNNPCKLVNGSVVTDGYPVYCDTPRCGTWEKEDKCAIMHCLNSDEKDPEKPKCTGNLGEGCINDQGILVTVGTTEMCQLPACTELKIDKCPGECQTGGGSPKEIFTCNGKGNRCKNATLKLLGGSEWSKKCPARPCSKLTDWAWEPSGSEKKTCLNKDDTQPKKTRTCEKYNAQPYDNFGCRDTKGVYFTPGEHVEKTVTLPGCPYWGPWRPKGQCTLDKKKLKGIQKETRRCLRHNSKGKDPYEKENVCVDKVGGLATQEKTCDYPWGKWIKTKNCLDNCVNDNQKSQIYATCDGGNNNNSSCEHETTNKIYSTAESITCGEVKPECGTWGKWSTCEFQSNKGYGSCNKKDGIKTRECSGSYCKDAEGLTGNKTDTQSCYSEKCQINIDNTIDKQITIDGLVKVDTDIFNKDVKIIISKNSYFTPPSVEECALSITSTYKKLTIINHGKITGRGGNGGAGAEPKIDHDWYLTDGPSPEISDGPSPEILAALNGGNGGNGGSAICITSGIKDYTIVNKGIIKGGRAGGGGGAATCYSTVTEFHPVLKASGDCAFGGKGGDGSDLYQPSIMIGKSEQTIIKDTFVIQSGAGGNGGVLFKEGPGPLEVDQIPRTAGFGKQGLSNNVPVLTKVITGKGGYPGVNGKACKWGENQCN